MSLKELDTQIENLIPVLERFQLARGPYEATGIVPKYRRGNDIPDGEYAKGEDAPEDFFLMLIHGTQMPEYKARIIAAMKAAGMTTAGKGSEQFIENYRVESVGNVNESTVAAFQEQLKAYIQQQSFKDRVRTKSGTDASLNKTQL